MEKMNTENIELYCVRAEFGTYTKQFIDGGYVAVVWLLFAVAGSRVSF
jgi:hypothetical protein